MQDVMNVVVMQNPDLKRELEEALFLLIQDMKNVIRSGHRPNITPLQRAIMPGLLRSLQNGQNTTQESTEREVFDRWRAHLGGDAVVETTVDTHVSP